MHAMNRLTFAPRPLTAALTVAMTALLLATSLAPTAAQAATKHPVKKTATKKAPAAPPAAEPDQVAAAQQVYYGAYDCDEKQTITVTAHATYPAYIDVKHAKTTYLMKPVASSTGATRLEDLKGEMLLVQIANKSMLMNVKRGQRLVDGCTNAQQRELVEGLKNQPASSAFDLAPPK
jgi:hypothetical protein